ncbi:claudin-34 [Bombina bombina]|uniref:claudin-34 n=1 Tax=Bombina bombina TaxID=8345 RepID=UPI00235B1853|nr:claudin-34 [Bombina bombina]
MPYLANTANLQLAGFAIVTMGWVLGCISTGLVQWRVWHVENTTIITSGIAWIGIWRACFFSQTLVSTNLRTMYCHEFSAMDSFLPYEIFFAQGLMVTAIILGAAGKALCMFALKNVYQNSSNLSLTTRCFTIGGILDLIAGLCIIIPVAWNLHSVVNNFSISFPSTYYMPTKPEKQEIGAALPVGIVAAILFFISGCCLLCYKLPRGPDSKIFPYPSEDSLFSDRWSVVSYDRSSAISNAFTKPSAHPIINCDGIKNEAFELDERL